MKTTTQIHDNVDQLKAGFIANIVVAASVAAYGSVLGIVAARKGLSWAELLMMNLSVFAGSAQFVMVDMWLPPLPVAEITMAVLVINLRYLLIGASLNPLFEGCSLRHKIFFMHLVADENWAMTMAHFQRSHITTWFLLGGGLCVQAAWSLGTITGHRLGTVIKNPEQFGLDFAFVAVFTALVFSFWRGKRDSVPWLITAVIALIAEKLLPGKWYILLGGLSGALASAVLIKNDREDAGDVQ
ncbi:AzlC family ABC transporter permease [Desulfopila aestuarii]|uniref:4-azaleucine resistance probable transporter AzlC n=1 Tax=Desulfopila aestuarii DSM 18488 TaxID=1121416 RepID=A0A1M7YME3_9BACT|nr:AzlC family ABC transporter permease [Desulfopila aestuarii]SHO53770.1 4-azaleucine resistance probable transporter AzlC [Desulfopila aestuarii DSM 18488]